MKINEVTKKSLKLVVETTADEVRAGLQQRLTTRDYDRTMSWVADEYNDFATQADVDRFVSDAAAERDNFWQMPYARAAREAIFGLRTGAGQQDDTPTGEDPIVSLDDVTPTDGVAPGNVTPRPGGVAGRSWDERYGETHNPDGTPKSETDRLRARRDQSLYPDTTPSPSERDPNDPRGDQTAPPPRAETPPAETPPAEEPPAEEPPAATPPTRPGQDTSGANFGEITSNLRRGSRGEGVRALQQRLGINADGIFGPQTEQAVRAFQQENNLQVDGVVGRQTLAALQGGEAQQPGRIGNAPATTAPATSPRPQARPVDPQAAAAVARTDNTGRRRIGTDAGDGMVWIVGNTNALTRVMPNDPRVAAQRAAVAARGNESVSRTENSLVEGIKKLAGLSNKKQLNEASVTINGAAEEIAELMRMMQLAGASGAKPVDDHDISSHMPKPMPTPCGAEKMGPPEPSMGDMIRMISSEEVATEEVDDGGFEDATTEPEEYVTANAGDVSDVIPAGNDLHKEKGAYPATAGGDNPMKIKEQLLKALAEKKRNLVAEAEVDLPSVEIDKTARQALKVAQLIKRKINSGDQMDDRDYNQMAELGHVLSRFGANFGPKSMKDVLEHMIEYTDERNAEGHGYPEFNVDRFKELIAMAKDSE